VAAKLAPEQVRAVVLQHADEHMVAPRAVFIAQATESGTLYTRSELTALSQCCRELGLYLYLDGARLGPALASRVADMTLPDVSALVDMFYLGGTKNGALLGEAIVITAPALRDHFRYHLKQRGALLAKRTAARPHSLSHCWRMASTCNSPAMPMPWRTRLADGLRPARSAFRERTGRQPGISGAPRHARRCASRTLRFPRLVAVGLAPIRRSG
jgi:hypothetical protein